MYIRPVSCSNLLLIIERNLTDIKYRYGNVNCACTHCMNKSDHICSICFANNRILSQHNLYICLICIISDVYSPDVSVLMLMQ